MAHKPIENQDQVLQACQVGITVLSDERSSTPNSMIEGVLSLKSLMRGILQGQLVVCAPESGDAPPVVASEVGDPAAEDKSVVAAKPKKKAARKKKKRAA